MAVVYDRLVGADADGNLSPAVQQILDARINDIATDLIPPLAPLQVLRIGDGSATLPIRPTTPNPIEFWTTSNPPLNGTTAGGTTGRVAGLDRWTGENGTGSSVSNRVTENPVGSGTYGNRPATTQSVVWEGVVAPGGGGTVAGGTPLMAFNPATGTVDKWEQMVLA